jgi:hypothetical protein
MINTSSLPKKTQPNEKLSKLDEIWMRDEYAIETTK